MRISVIKRSLIVACAGLLAVCSIVLVHATEADTFMLPLEVYGRNVVSMALPAISEESGSPFDFIIDPQGLIYETDAAKYGGGKVEEGATVLFRNHGGDYDFSSQSDMLSVRNQSNVPVTVKITASVSDLGEVNVVSSPDFDGDACSIYLAIVDDEGNVQPVSEDGEVSVTVEMMRAPDDAYYFRYDEETGEYTYDYSSDPDSLAFDTYSFGLVGYCNPEGRWEDISVHPSVTVTWNFEPIMSEENAYMDEEEFAESVDIVEEEDTSEQIGEEEYAEDESIDREPVESEPAEKPAVENESAGGDLYTAEPGSEAPLSEEANDQ